MNIANEILEFLRKDALISNRKESLKERINKLFPDYSNHTDTVIEELIVVADNNPQIIMDITKGFLENRKNISKLWESNILRKLKNVKPGDMISLKAKAIASMYEISSMFSFMVLLLTKQKVIIKPGSDSQQILKHFRTLGLTTRDRDDLRIIRNAISHKNSFDGEYLIFENERVAIARVDQLYYKLNDLMNWNLNLILYSLLYIPKFGILVALEIFLHLDKFNSEWQRYFDGVKSFYKTELEKLREEKAKRKAGKKIKRKRTPEELKARDEEVQKFIIGNIELIADRWRHHAISLANLLNEMDDKISTDDERKSLIHVSNWIRSHENLFVEIRDQYKADPQKYSLLLFGREELTI